MLYDYNDQVLPPKFLYEMYNSKTQCNFVVYTIFSHNHHINHVRNVPVGIFIDQVIKMSTELYKPECV